MLYIQNVKYLKPTFNLPDFTGAKIIKKNYAYVYGYGNRIIVTKEGGGYNPEDDALQLKYVGAISTLATQTNQSWPNGSYVAFATKSQMTALQAANMFADFENAPTIPYLIKY